MAGITPAGKVALRGAGWLVLGQSYSPGWRAWCTDRSGSEHELGSPRQIDGFANGWRINGATCLSARFAFGPQRFADIGYWISGLVGLSLLVLLSLGAWRRRGGGGATPGATSVTAKTAVELRTSDGVELIVSPSPGNPKRSARGELGSRAAPWLFGSSALAVVAVGLLYVVNPSISAQGINFDYSIDHTVEHWIALAAMIVLIVGAVVDIVARRRGSSDDG
ncbi:unannotated protein [freshwater metagenome]|uniref:Unannotated protein n=1 Tax=freshwater metagenome TaxID=449393 RepID=A0A6J7RH14_9ZZZZ